MRSLAVNSWWVKSESCVESPALLKNKIIQFNDEKHYSSDVL